MKFSTVAFAVLAALAEARPEFTNSNFEIEAGVPFTLKWSNAVGDVTITLKNGPADNLKTVQVIDSGDSGTSFTWTPPATLPSGTYAFEIQDESGDEPNFSTQFTFAGSASASVSSVSATATNSASETSSTGSATESTSATTSTSGTTSTASSSSSATGSSTSSASTTLTTTTSSSSNSSTSTSSSASSASTAASTTTSTPINTNDSKRLGSPLALVLVAVASLLYFN